MSENNGAGGSETRNAFEEIVWTLKKIRILFRYWMLPPNKPTIEAAKDDRTSATALALFVIVALSYAVRGAGNSDATAITTIASGVALALSVGLNILSKQFRIDVSEQIVISAYVSVIIVMLSYIVFQMALQGEVYFIIYFQQRFGNIAGPIIAPAIVAVVFTYVLYVLKAALWDRATMTAVGAAHGFLIVLFSGVIVAIVALLTDSQFQKVIGLIKAS